MYISSCVGFLRREASREKNLLIFQPRQLKLSEIVKHVKIYNVHFFLGIFRFIFPKYGGHLEFEMTRAAFENYLSMLAQNWYAVTLCYCKIYQ